MTLHAIAIGARNFGEKNFAAFLTLFNPSKSLCELILTRNLWAMNMTVSEPEPTQRVAASTAALALIPLGGQVQPRSHQRGMATRSSATRIVLNERVRLLQSGREVLLN
jgi:hypothetical protein